MRLVLFDIDGTLTRTYDVDTSCYVQALADVLAIVDVDTDWSQYPDTTDSGIIGHVVQNRLGRDPSDDEILRVKKHFYSLLSGFFSDDAALCRPVAGGPQFLETLVNHSDWAVAFATGGWEATARLKLGVAGYQQDGIPMASADDSHHRSEICSIAVARSLSRYAVQAFDSIVSIGDGVWDARTAASMGCRFIGVGSNRTAETLENEGAEFVVADFNDLKIQDAFFDAH